MWRQTVGRILAPTAVATTASFAPPSQCNAGSAKVFAFFPSFCFDFVHNTAAALHSFHQFESLHLKHLALCSLHDMSTKSWWFASTWVTLELRAEEMSHNSVQRAIDWVAPETPFPPSLSPPILPTLLPLPPPIGEAPGVPHVSLQVSHAQSVQKTVWY